MKLGETTVRAGYPDTLLTRDAAIDAEQSLAQQVDALMYQDDDQRLILGAPVCQGTNSDDADTGGLRAFMALANLKLHLLPCSRLRKPTPSISE